MAVICTYVDQKLLISEERGRNCILFWRITKVGMWIQKSKLTFTRTPGVRLDGHGRIQEKYI